MKPFVFVLLPLLAFAAPPRSTPDPTRMSQAMGEVLKAQLAEFRSIEVPALVAAASSNGVALVRTAGETEAHVVRTGSKLTLRASGIPFPVKVRGVTAAGVTLAAETLDGEWSVPSAFARTVAVPAATNALSYVEFDQVPLKTALRMLADQCGRNFVCTESAAARKVSLFLRGASVDDVVDELCKSHALWFRCDAASGIVRILTMDEFRENLTSFQQEEQCETFTLLYPNVTEVASIIQGVFADRVRLSLGDEDVLDDELDDLSRRFERFNAVSDTSTSSDLMGNFNNVNNRNNSLYGRGRGRGGVYSARGGMFLDFPNRSGEERAERSQLRRITATDAERLQPVVAAGTNVAQVAAALGEFRSQLPSIYVTVARRSNLLVVRTADPRALEEIRRLVKRVDVPTPMVLLEVEVMELTLDDGVNSVFDYNLVADELTVGGHSRYRVSGSTAFPLDPNSITFDVWSKHLDTVIKLERSRGKVKTLATPTLLTAHNEVSQLFIGEEVPITKNVTSTTIVTDEGNTVSTPQTETEWEKVGVRLLITPNINADRTVTLRLMQENSEVHEGGGKILVVNTRSGSTEPYDVDTIRSRSVAGTFVAQDRMAIVAGGLIKETLQDSENGIPWLMDIPWLGWFFRSTSRGKTRTELVVYLKPHVLSTPAEAAGVNSRFTDSKVRNPHADVYRSKKGLQKELRDRDEARRDEKELDFLPDVGTFYVK